MGRWLKLSSRQLKVNRGGRKKGEGRHLTQAQEDRLRKLITDKAPDQLKLNYALWTRKAVQRWLDEDYPAIKAKYEESEQGLDNSGRKRVVHICLHDVLQIQGQVIRVGARNAHAHRFRTFSRA